MRRTISPRVDQIRNAGRSVSRALTTDLTYGSHQRCVFRSETACYRSRTLLTRLDGQQLHWMIDPDGRQLLPEIRWMGETLSSDVPVFTVLACWRARCTGIDLGVAACGLAAVGSPACLDHAAYGWRNAG